MSTLSKIFIGGLAVTTLSTHAGWAEVDKQDYFEENRMPTVHNGQSWLQIAPQSSCNTLPQHVFERYNNAGELPDIVGFLDNGMQLRVFRDGDGGSWGTAMITGRGEDAMACFKDAEGNTYETNEVYNTNGELIKTQMIGDIHGYEDGNLTGKQIITLDHETGGFTIDTYSISNETEEVSSSPNSSINGVTFYIMSTQEVHDYAAELTGLRLGL